jgi:hypothetical protein
MFKKVGFVAVRLLLIPGICEAVISGFTAVGMFGMPILIGLALGFILKPVDPAIAIHVMTQYQKEGRGVLKGPPSPPVPLPPPPGPLPPSPSLPVCAHTHSSNVCAGGGWVGWGCCAGGLGWGGGLPACAY